MPHVLMEKGDMTLGEFEQHLKGRTEFIKGMKKDSRAERQVRVAGAASVWQKWGDTGNWVITAPMRILSRGRGWLAWSFSQRAGGRSSSMLPSVGWGTSRKVDIQMRRLPCSPASCQAACSWCHQGA